MHGTRCLFTSTPAAFDRKPRDGRAKTAREMRPAFGPIETGTTERPRFPFQRCDIDAFSQESVSPRPATDQAPQALRPAAYDRRNARTERLPHPREVIVAEARVAHCGFPWTGARALEPNPQQGPSMFPRLRPTSGPARCSSSGAVPARGPPASPHPAALRDAGGCRRGNARFSGAFPRGQTPSRPSVLREIGVGRDRNQRCEGRQCQDHSSWRLLYSSARGDASSFAKTSWLRTALQQASPTEERHS